jgi:hypothetical protein
MTSTPEIYGDYAGFSHKGPTTHGRYRICLNCALPPQDRESSTECDCLPREEEVQDDWLDFGGAEVAVAFCIGILCLSLTCGGWF